MVLLLLVTFFSSWLLTWAIRKAAFKFDIMDVPNDRSSHTQVTPRGGGLSFTIIFLLGIAFFSPYLALSQQVSSGLIFPGFLVALIGFLDDLGHVPARYRLIGHVAAGVLALFLINGMPSIHVLSYDIPAGMILNGMMVLFITWMINLYNFMDGIDGLAAVETISACTLMAIIYMLASHPQLAMIPLFLSAAVLGFLYWNFPVAKVFMGDAGSGFLGFGLSFLALVSAREDTAFLFCWLILLGGFVVDSTFTLLSRMFHGDKIYEAHRSHAYQHAAQKLSSHKWVTCIVLMINVVWLFPIAYFVALQYLDGFWGLCFAYLPLVCLATKLKAGKTGSVYKSNVS